MKEVINMQKINFEDGVTSISAGTFNAFQNNIEDAFVNYKAGELTINQDVIKNGNLAYVSLTKDENNTVNLSLRWNIDSNNPIKANTDYRIAYLPQEFRPAVNYVYGGARAEKPYGNATFVIAQEDGRIVITASQVSSIIAMSATFKAQGGIQV